MLAQLPDRRVVLEGVADHQLHVVVRRPRRPAPRRRRRTWPAASRRGRACRRSSARIATSVMRARAAWPPAPRRPRSRTASSRSGGTPYRRIERLGFLPPALVGVDHRDRHVGHRAQHPDVFAPPIPVADDGHVHALHHEFPPDLPPALCVPPVAPQRHLGATPPPFVRKFVDRCYTVVTDSILTNGPVAAVRAPDRRPFATRRVTGRDTVPGTSITPPAAAFLVIPTVVPPLVAAAVRDSAAAGTRCRRSSTVRGLHGPPQCILSRAASQRPHVMDVARVPGGDCCRAVPVARRSMPCDTRSMTCRNCLASLNAHIE